MVSLCAVACGSGGNNNSPSGVPTSASASATASATAAHDLLLAPVRDDLRLSRAQGEVQICPGLPSEMYPRLVTALSRSAALVV